MPGKYTNDEEKARILAWRQENVPIKVICEHSGRGKATVMTILAAAKELTYITVPKHKFGGGRRRKTSKFTDAIMKQKLQKNPCLTALELQTLHPNLLENVTLLFHVLLFHVNPIENCWQKMKKTCQKRRLLIWIPFRKS